MFGGYMYAGAPFGGNASNTAFYAKALAENIINVDNLVTALTARRTYTEIITPTSIVMTGKIAVNPRIRIIGISINDFPRVLVADDKSRKSGTKIDNTGDLRILLKK